MPRPSPTLALVLLEMAILASGWSGVLAEVGATIDATDTVVRVIDGDTFDARRLGRIRLADVDAPELGEPGSDEATGYLRFLIRWRPVFLDIDDLQEKDRYGRIVAVVYVEHNATHLLNVNRALLDVGRVRVADFPNEFDPDAWARYVPRPSGYSPTFRDFDWLAALSIPAILTLASMGVFALLRSRTSVWPGKH